MTSCEDILDLISLRLDGELTVEQEAELAEHLDACPACRALARDLEDIHSAMPGMNVEAPPSIMENVMARIKAEERAPIPFPGKKEHSRHWRAWGAAAAALVLAASGMFALWGGGTKGGETMMLSALPSSTPMMDAAEPELARRALAEDEDIEPMEPAPSADEGDTAQRSTGAVEENGVSVEQEAPAFYGRTPPSQADAQPSETPEATPTQAPSTFQITTAVIDPQNGGGSGGVGGGGAASAEPISHLTAAGAAKKLYEEKFAALYPDYDAGDMAVDGEDSVVCRFSGAELVYTGQNAEKTAYLFQYTVSGEESVGYLVPADGSEIEIVAEE